MPSPRKGGWRSYTGMHWAEKRLIHELAYRAGFNVVLDVHPPEGFEGSEQDRKRWCRDRIRAFGQALKRRGQKWIGVTIWEQSEESHRHGHHLCRVERNNLDLLEKFDNETILPLRLTRQNFGDAIGYRTKERLPLGDEIERKLCQSRHNHRRKGSRIRGRRVTFHKDARAFVANDPVMRELWMKSNGRIGDLPANDTRG